MQSIARDTVEPLSRWERLAFAAGIIAATLYLAGVAIFAAFVVPYMPPMSAPVTEAASFYAELSRGFVYKFVSYLGQAELPFLALFFGGLFGVLRRMEGDSGALAAAIFAAGIANAIILPIIIVVENHVLLGLAAAGGDPLTVRAFDGMGPVSFGLSGFAQALIVVGTAALLRSVQLTPRWIEWLASIVAVASMIGTLTLMWGGMFPVAALATMLFRIWMLALSITLLRRAPAWQGAASRLVPA